MAICICGCEGKITWQAHHKYRPPRFLPGHHTRTAEFLATRAALVVEPPKDWSIPTGLCECGCGEKTTIAERTFRHHDIYRGFPLRYIHGHNPRGKRAHGWKGGVKVNKLGYRFVWLPERNGYVPEHRLRWEEDSGRTLLPAEHVHHLDGNPANNNPKNLVALSARDHSKLHSGSALTHQRLSEAHKKRYQDPAARKKTSDKMKTIWASRRQSKP